MIEFVIGSALATAAGLNAYIPLLALGLADRFLPFVELPPSWSWLSNDWVLIILGVLLVLELIADALPAVDSVNDVIQTVVRPTAGGLAFGAGSMAQTRVVTDPASFFSSNAWVPIAFGIAIALIVHFVKMAARPVLNASTAGVAAPVVSTTENVASVSLSVTAILAPIVALLILVGIIVGVVLLFRRRRKRRGAAAPLPPAT